MAIGMPDEQRLPASARRELVVALHALYTDAGRPGTRAVATMRGLAFFGQGFDRQFMRRVATPRTRHVLRLGDGNPRPSEDVCDCTRIRCT